VRAGTRSGTSGMTSMVKIAGGDYRPRAALGFSQLQATHVTGGSSCPPYHPYLCEACAYVAIPCVLLFGQGLHIQHLDAQQMAVSIRFWVRAPHARSRSLMAKKLLPEHRITGLDTFGCRRGLYEHQLLV